MSMYPDKLDPPNEQKHVVLPDPAHSVSKVARSHGSIVKAYANAISFIDHMGAMEGYMTIVGGFGFLMAATYFSLTISDGYLWFTIIMAIGAIVCLLIIRSDAIAYRYQPVIFNRVTQKIHVFIDEGIWSGKLWQFISPSRIESWDWACARAEVVEFITLGGGSVPRTNYALICVVTDVPGSHIAIARFGVGISSAYESESMVQRWEHIRRFMNGTGPHLADGELLYRDESTTSLWGALTWGQPLLGPGSKIFWTGQALHGMWFLTIPGGAFFLILLPITMLAGLMRWISHVAKSEPTWPHEILETLGAEASPSELMKEAEKKGRTRTNVQ